MIGEKVGNYTILQTLGAGSTGTVYKAEDSSGRIVAVKFVRSNVLCDRERRERFLQGLLIASEVRHRSVCPILDMGDDNDDFFLVMPFLSGKTLEQFAEGRPLPWPRALDIAIEAGEAVAAVHQLGAPHRAVKPSNIWIQSNGALILADACIARFTEFEKRIGIAPRYGFTEMPMPPKALAYMAPEQVRGDPVDRRSDIFSLGIVLYEMLTGRHPFDSRNSISRISAILEGDVPPLGSKAQALPQELQPILLRAMSKLPADRYPTMEEFLTHLRGVRGSCAASPAPASEGRWWIRRGAPALAAAALFALFALIVLLAFAR
jgi:serine/threonine-protein kinase